MWFVFCSRSSTKCATLKLIMMSTAPVYVATILSLVPWLKAVTCPAPQTLATASLCMFHTSLAVC